jgi:hypothetical protein
MLHYCWGLTGSHNNKRQNWVERVDNQPLENTRSCEVGLFAIASVGGDIYHS